MSGDPMRYQRQMQVPEVGAAGQAMLRGAHLLIVGAGGLGVPVLQYLVGAGVGRITLIDPDNIEQSNLHRQPIYAAYVGQPKVEAAADLMRALNPEVALQPLAQWLTPENAPKLVDQADIILDCADSFAVSYLLSDLCYAQNKPLISASVLGMEGYVGGFCGAAPSLRALFPDLPTQGATCATAGVLGPVVGLFGMLQAQMALAWILRLSPSPLGQLIRYDMRGFRWSSFRFDQAQEPAETPHIFLSPQNVTAQDWVVELRDAAEAPRLIVPHAQRLPDGDFGPSDVHPAKGQRAIFICRSGLRAWRAADQLRAHWDGEIALIADPAQ